jgi:hypothetical protein
MSPLGGIFDYQSSALGFEALSAFFMIAYGAVVMWVSSHSASPAVEALRAKLQSRG